MSTLEVAPRLNVEEFSRIQRWGFDYAITPPGENEDPMTEHLQVAEGVKEAVMDCLYNGFWIKDVLFCLMNEAISQNPYDIDDYRWKAKMLGLNQCQSEAEKKAFKLGYSIGILWGQYLPSAHQPSNNRSAEPFVSPITSVFDLDTLPPIGDLSVSDYLDYLEREDIFPTKELKEWGQAYRNHTQQKQVKTVEEDTNAN